MCRNLNLRFLFLLSSVKVFFPVPFCFFWLNILLSFLILLNWFLFLSSFIFPLIFQYCFIPVSLAHVVSSLTYLNLLGLKCLVVIVVFKLSYIFPSRLSSLSIQVTMDMDVNCDSAGVGRPVLFDRLQLWLLEAVFC
jgi:hypothetical protein